MSTDEKPILICGETPTALRYLRITAFLVTIGALFIPDATARIVVCTLGGACCLGLETYTAVLRTRRAWLKDHGTGFSLSDRNGQREYADGDVGEIAFESRRLYSNGVAKRYRRICHIWVADEPQAIEFDNTFKLDQADPLGKFLERIMNGLRNRSEQVLRAGGQVSGDGWSLDNRHLSIQQNRTELETPIAELADCNSFDDQVCVWRVGQDDAFARIPVKSRNAWLLPALLLPRLGAARQRSEPDSENGLGRILFERRPSRMMPILLFILAGLLGFCSIGALAVGILNPRERGAIGAGCVILPIATALALWAFSARSSVLCCRQRGVSKSGLFGKSELEYRHVRSFTYQAVRHYHNGVYIGTNISLRFDPVPESEAKPIRYSTTVKGEDGTIDELRDFVSQAVASRMAESFANGQTVRWTDNLAFRPDGIEFRASGFLGRKPAELLPFEEYQGFSFDQGKFALFRKGVAKPIATESSSAPNFFPGFYLLHILLHTENPTGAQA